MSGLLEVLSRQLSGPAVQQMSKQIDADPATTQKALAAALPMLVGGLARNATKSPEGAHSLAQALERDHDGSLLDGLSSLLGGGSGGLGSLLGGGSGGSGLGGLIGGLMTGAAGGGTASRTTDGDGILGHILGGKRDAIEQGVARSSGLDAGKVSQLLTMLAPIVMGALGRVKQQQNLDAGGLASLLNQERTRVEQDTPGMQQGTLLDLLDMDKDGDVSDDVAKIGSFLSNSGVLGKLFG